MPARKPTAVKIAQGTAQKCRMNPNEAEPPVEVPSAPAWMENDAVAMEEWNRITPLLADQGLISHMDMAELAIYCSAYSENAAAEKRVQEEGTYVMNRFDEEVVAPWVGVREKAQQKMHTFLRQFGMTPASRSGVKAVKKEPDNPLAQFLKPLPFTVIK
jgi:P27 family predicted phage terminase small subunit